MSTPRFDMDLDDPRWTDGTFEFPSRADLEREPSHPDRIPDDHPGPFKERREEQKDGT